MKKLIIGAAIAASLTSSAFATDLHLGVSSVEAMGESGTEYSLGFGWDNRDKMKSDTGFFWGGSFDYGIADIKGEDLGTFTGDLKIGYTPLKDLAVYAIGSGAIQSYDSVNAYGFGYGAGIDYKISDSFAVAAEYKSYTMTPDIDGVAGVDYDFDKVGVNLKYIF